MPFGTEKHAQSLPTPRKIRRTCNKELYRALKKMKIWITPDQIIQAEEIYYQKVLAHLPWIVEHESNRKALCDWWDEAVCEEISALWNVPAPALARAFRQSFGG